jgi:hypothetical protein
MGDVELMMCVLLIIAIAFIAIIACYKVYMEISLRGKSTLSKSDKIICVYDVNYASKVPLCANRIIKVVRYGNATLTSLYYHAGFGEEKFYYVKETPEEIANLINA